MEIIQGLKKIKKYKNAVVALGVFDGVHRGHRKILAYAVKTAVRIKGKSIALTFYPHPQKEASLYSIEHRLKLIAELGIDACIVIKFTKAFSRMEPQNFVTGILVKKIGARFIFIGKNFRFGKNCSGDHRLLEEKSRAGNFKLKVFNVLKSNNRIISSTLIRRLIKSSRLKEAEKLLGRRVSILGTVGKGSRLGRILGFPTANINPHHEIVPAPGVYAVKIFFSKKIYYGACYIGTRPTISPSNRKIRIEVHIFDFRKNIYGKTLEIQFLKLIRNDIRFATFSDLSSQIRKDVAACRKIHKI